MRRAAPLWYFGGKHYLATRIVSLIDGVGRIYVEPFCGAASVFWHKQPHPVEVLNDLNQDIVNFFECLQRPKTFVRLLHRLLFTPYSRAMFRKAIQILDNPAADRLDRAWAFFVIRNQSMSAGSRGKTTEGCWGRTCVSARGMAHTCAAWISRLERLEWYHQRLLRVQLDCRDGLEVIRYWDRPDTVFYIDPPYPLSTRKKGCGYRYEMSDQQHQELVDVLLALKGRAVVSSYPNPIYQRLAEAGWNMQAFHRPCCSVVITKALQAKGCTARGTEWPRTELLFWNFPAPSEVGLVAIADKDCTGGTEYGDDKVSTTQTETAEGGRAAGGAIADVEATETGA